MNTLNSKQGQQLTKDLLELCEQDKDLLETIMDDYVYKLNDKEVQDYKNGKDKLMGFFVGQIMKEMKGKANPKVLNEILNKLLKE